MKTTLVAKLRNEHGRGASRRMRRTGSVPAIIYGADIEAMALTLDHNTIFYALKKEEFHTSILNIEIDGKVEQALLRDFHMHAYRPQVLHLDFQRVTDKEEVQIRIPLHFINEDTSHAVKVQAAHISHIANDVEIRAFAKDIPHFIEVDMQDLHVGQTIHLSDLVLPKGVKLTSIIRGEDAPIAFAAGIAEAVEEDLVAVSVADIPTVETVKKSDE
jgi:large subunit ribosomal protein L25